MSNKKSHSGITISDICLQTVMDTVLDGLLIIDSNGIIQSFNSAAQRIFGYTASEVIGQNVSILMATPYGEKHDEYIRQYLETGNKKVIGIGREVEACRKDGSIFPIEIGINQMYIQNQIMFVGTIRDISERKDFIKKLEQSNQELKEFAYVASHDLKSPLRAIGSLTSWIKEDAWDLLDEQNKERIETISSRILRMERLLDDLLDYSRAGNTPVDSKSVNAKDLITDIEKNLLNPEKKVTINVAQDMEDCYVPIMPLDRIFHNLINNAIKHHDKNLVKINISCEKLKDFYKISVTDDGPGIPSSFHDCIFEMFKTLKPRDEVEGSGMGLAITRKLLNKHGGEISVISDEGRGACFSFTWPLE